MMRKGKRTKVFAILMALIMTLMSVDVSVFALDSESSMNPSSSKSGAVSQTGGESEGSNESGDSDSSDSSGTKAAETMDALLAISWYDGENAEDKRPDDIRKLIEIYADGTRIDEAKQEITLLNEDADGDGTPDPEKEYGLETYYYLIHKLPVYAEDEDGNRQGNAITYTVKENTQAIPDYKAADLSVLGKDIEEIEDEILGPEDTLTLQAYDGKALKAEKRFLNYLSEQAVANSAADKEGAAVGKKSSDQDISLAANTDNTNKTCTKTGTAKTDVVWYDTTGGKTYEHAGQLEIEMEYSVGEGADAVGRTIALTWDPDVEGYYHQYDAEDAALLGVDVSTNDKKTWLWLWDEGDNYLNRSLQAWNLPDTVTTTETDESGSQNQSEQKVAWQVKVTGCTATSSANDDRVTGYSVYPNKANDGATEGYILYPLMTFTLNMDIRSGNDDAAAWMDIFFRNMGLKFSCVGADGTTLEYDKDKNDTFSATALAQAFQDHFGVSHDQSGNTFVEMTRNDDGSYRITIKKLPIYDGNKKEINYSVITKAQTITSEDGNGNYWYVVEFDNTSVPGHGTDISAGYNDGMIILTKTGTTEYNAFKIWQDEEDENKDYIGEERPQTTWTLWRYSENGGSYVSAAQVFYDLESRSLIVQSYGYDDDGQMLDDSKTSYDINKWQTRGYTIEKFLIENLPAYDAEGYSYIYFARESKVTDERYARYYGSKTDAGYFSSKDVLPENYQETVNSDTRLVDDNSIYNGGAVANRQEQMTTVSVTKKWVAAYYQNQLDNIEVDFKLQAKHKYKQNAYGGMDPSYRNDWYDVQDENGKYVTITLKDFDAYNMTRTGSVEVNRYCDNGHELEYRWVETTVYEVSKDENGNKTRKEIKWFDTSDGEKAFRLSVNEKTLKEESCEHSDEYFVSESKRDGNDTTITNTLEGRTEYYVKKTWDDDLTAGPINVTIEQYDAAGRQVKTWKEKLTKDTPVSNEKNAGTAYGGDYANKDSGWVHLFENLPKYDETGNLYTYVVRETDSKYVAEYIYDNDVDGDNEKEKNSVRIRNAVPGVVNTIDVRKVWLDDSTTEDRDECSFAVYAGTYGNDGVLLYGEVGDKTGLLSKEFVKVNEASSWWKHVDVTLFSYIDQDGKTVYRTREQTDDWNTIKEYTIENGKPTESNRTYATKSDWQEAHLVEEFYITENKIGDQEVETGKVSSQGYPVTESGDTSYITIYNNNTDQDNYDCTDAEDSQDYYTVINRRIGEVKYEVTKKWNDGESSAAERQKWNASLTLSCDEDPQHAVIEKNEDEGGNKTDVSYGYTRRPVNAAYSDDDSQLENAVGEILAKEDYGYAPIYDNENNQISSTQALGKTAQDSNTETVSYTNLPMYDFQGRLLHYSVKEDMNDQITENGNQIQCEYSTSYGDKEYKVNHESSATESQTITNTLTDTQEYEWHLLWLDAYRNANNQRPDIYLTIYQTEYQYDGDGKLVKGADGKPFYTIKQHSFVEYLWTEHSDVNNTEDYWTASFNLPQYDEHGTEIIYYANIDTKANHEIVDYLDSQYAAGTVGNVSSFEGEDHDGNKTNTSSVRYDEGTDSYTVNYETDRSIVNAYTSAGDGKVYVLESGNTFVNQIKQNVNVNGRKVWENLPQGFPANELPMLTFNLYRLKMNADGEYLLAGGGTTKEYDESWSHEVKKQGEAYVLEAKHGLRTYQYQIELASIIKDVKSPSADYNFMMKHVGYNDIDGNSLAKEQEWGELKAAGYNLVSEAYGGPMEKYDSSGNMYKYTIVETIATNQTGKIEQAYENLSGSVNGYGITNTYNITTNVEGIKLKKSWDLGVLGNNAIKDYPGTEYTLYRFFKYTNDTSSDSDYSQPEEVVTKTLTAENAANGDVDFGDQLVYAPNGTAYIYFIVEKPVKGYQNNGFNITSNENEASPDEDKNGWPDGSNGKWFPGMKTSDGWGSGAFTLTQNDNASGSSNSGRSLWQRALAFLGLEDSTVQLTTTNEYTGLPQAKLQGKKVWKDYDNLFGTRPESLALRVCRWGSNDLGNGKGSYQYIGDLTLNVEYGDDGTAISINPEWEPSVPGDDGYAPNVTGDIEVSATIDSDGSWNYTISGLDGYYTSGHKYYYEIYEVEPDHYNGENEKLVSGHKTEKSSTDQAGNVYRDITMQDFVNNNYTSLSVIKNWQDLNPDLELPEVKVGLQISPDNGTTWYWADKYFDYYFSGLFEYFKPADAYRTLEKGKWSASYEYLPAGYVDENGYHEFQYRAAEVSVGGVAVEYETDADSEKVETVTGGLDKNVGSYVIKAVSTEDNKTTITNTAETTELTVTKTWQNDKNNDLEARGKADGVTGSAAEDDWSVAYHLYRGYKAHDSDPETVTEQVYAKDGKTPYTIIVSGSNSDAEKSATVTGLPAASPEGKTYAYYAVELNSDGKEVSEHNGQDTYNGAYTVKTTFGGNSKDGFTTAVTNRMIMKEFDVVKKGRSSDGTLTDIKNGYTFSISGKFRGDEWKITGEETRYIGTVPEGEEALAAEALLTSDGISGGNTQPEYLYALKETAAPKGYQRSDKTVYFYLTEQGEAVIYRITDGDGKAVAEDAWADTAEADNSEYAKIVFKDDPFKIDIVKTDSGDKDELAGAEFSLESSSDVRTWSYVEHDGKKINGIDAKLTTGEDGRISLDSVEYGLSVGSRYRLTETKTPDGYITDDPKLSVTFMIKDDGTVAPAGDGDIDETVNDNVSFADDGGTIQIENRKTKFYINKLDNETGKTLSGAELAIYKADDFDSENGELTKPKDETTPVATLTSSNGSFAEGLSENQDYVLYEVKAPDGYDVFKPVEFTMKTGNVIALKGKTRDDVKLSGPDKDDNYTISAEDLRVRGNVELTKLDEVSGEGISGVLFKLSYIPAGGTEDDRKELTEATDKDGKLSFSNLPMGRYTLTEISAEGYDINGRHDESNKPFICEFTIDQDDHGKTFVINKAAEAADAEQKITVKQGHLGEDGIINARILGSVTLYKLDGENTDQALSGVEFTLFKLDEAEGLWETLSSLLTGKTYSQVGNFQGSELSSAGKLVIEDLEWGTYKLVETKSRDGYTAIDKATDQALETVEFTIDRSSNKDIELNTDGNRFYNFRTALTLRKQAEDGRMLAGAKFQLNGRYVDAGGNTVDGTLDMKTDSSGRIELKGVLICGEDYTLTEVAAPAGYQELTETLRFTVLEDGTVEVIEDLPGYELTASGFFDNQITVTNQPEKTVGTKGVKTSDDSHMMFWLILMLLAAAGASVIFLWNRKKTKTAKK